ncbi:MAG: flagellar basal body L-ring protein FlgH [Xanthomonadaceae bacterium]|nr:flagellar basal body L-ring protein FlgH [Xanthomonadaceae bacterium]
MRKLALVVVLLGLAVSGCQTLPPLPFPDDEEDYAPPELDYSLPPTTSGGLFRPGYGYGSLLQDRRAFQVGDILTVVLNESTQSSKSSGTSIGKTSSVGIGVPRLFGRDQSDLETALAAERDFGGSAKSSQQNTLRGSIAVTVHQVLPNGVLLVKGEKWLRLNQGDEFIRLTGLVRIEDIDHNNRVLSQNVANARISYAGRGALSDANSPGWLTRFFNSPWFPF